MRVRCAWADRQAEGESRTGGDEAGLNLVGLLAQKLGRQQKKCSQVSMLGAIWSNQTACSNMVLFAALPSEWAVFYNASLSEWGHKHDKALLRKKG